MTDSRRRKNEDKERDKERETDRQRQRAAPRRRKIEREGLMNLGEGGEADEIWKMKARQ